MNVPVKTLLGQTCMSNSPGLLHCWPLFFYTAICINWTVIGQLHSLVRKGKAIFHESQMHANRLSVTVATLNYFIIISIKVNWQTWLQGIKLQIICKTSRAEWTLVACWRSIQIKLTHMSEEVLARYAASQLNRLLACTRLDFDSHRTGLHHLQRFVVFGLARNKTRIKRAISQKPRKIF